MDVWYIGVHIPLIHSAKEETHTGILGILIHVF